MNKKILNLILTLLYILSFTTYANDYSDSWANKEISFLLEKGFISGDSLGNINPDTDIKRCEFVKVINKIMGYKNKADKNFSDVASDCWYYEDFLIARANSVIGGDEHGNASPESYITREEAFKILATVLKLTDEKNLSFKDEEQISDWAIPFIKRVVNSGLINGYRDGTIRPKNNITRAEAFYIMNAVYNLNKIEEEKQEVIIPPVSTVGKRPSGGGGGGGGGSSGSNVNKTEITTPVITVADGCSIEWTKSDNAKSYVIFLTYNDKTIEKEFDQAKRRVDLTEEISGFCESARGVEEIEVSVSISAKSSSGKISDKSKPAVLRVNIDKILSSKDLGLTVSYKTIDGVRGFFVEWTDETVSKIVIKAETEDKIYQNPKMPLNITEDITKDDFIYKIIATANGGKEIGNIALKDSYFDGGDGTEENPYIISEGFQFLNVARNMKAHYLQTEDIIIEEEMKPLSVIAGEPFSGTYKTRNNESKKITATISDIGKYTSLFGQISGAEIDGIISAGEVNASGDYAGGLFGEIKNSKITNCENQMTVNSSASHVGGIAGYSTGTEFFNVKNSGNINAKSYVAGIVGSCISVTLENCVNEGSVNGETEVAAGIAGNVATKLSTPSVISGCKNYGWISVYGTSVSKQYVGGITAKLMDADAIFTKNSNYGNVSASKYSAAGVVVHVQGSTVSECYNDGTVTGQSYVSGIAGYGGLASVRIRDCLNTGIIDAGLSGLAAGIFSSGISGNEIISCINLGEICGKNQYLYPIGDYKNISVLTSNYYLTPQSPYMNIYDGASELSLLEWSELVSKRELPDGFSSDVWEYVELSETNKFPLPQLKENGCPDKEFSLED